VADKLTPLILDALARAVAEPSGSPLFASRSVPGLFPAVAAAKPAAHKCIQEGLIRMVRTDGQGKQLREYYAGTPTGLKYLIDHASPKQVLDDFVRLLEERRDEVGELLAAVERMAAGIEGMKAAAAAVLPRVEVDRLPVDHLRGEPCERLASSAPRGRGELQTAVLEPVTTAELCELIHTRLRDWASSAGVPRDCPLPELFTSLSTLDPAPTVGQFHDALRQLHADGRVYLHPWTGPLYALPEPAVALLSGHEIAFYASLRESLVVTR
jgi:hypothetical protein